MSERKFPPGPRSLVPGRVVKALRKDPLGFLAGLRKTFGDVAGFYAFGTRYVVVSHPELAKEILLTEADAYWKGPALQNSKGILGEGLLTAEGDNHKKQRRMMQGSFHAKHVEHYTGDILASTREMLGRWRETCGAGNGQGEMEMHREMMGLTLVIAGRTLFGTILSEQIETVRRCMHDLMGNYRRAVVPWGKLLNLLPLPTTVKLAKAQRDMRQVVGRIIAARRAEVGRGEPRRDLMSMMIAATDDEGGVKGVKMNDEQLRDQAITILTASHETTANAMTFTLYLLAKHPAEQRRLREEVRAVLGGREPTVEMVEKLPRARWVLAESMRLYPPAWTLGRQNRRVVEVGGYRLPAKSTVLIPQWAIHRDERFWERPEEFLPERWRDPKHPRYAYLPFSTGPRNCIGESFAWLEMILALAMVVREFEVEPPAGAAEMRLSPAITLRPSGGVKMIVTAQQ